jgi:hypothetical protein
MTRTSKETGNALETAVRAIEGAIIKSSPAFAEGTFEIEGNKVVSIGGVRHEVDVYVHATLAPGYSAVFLFECKNWQKPVGKNEIIVFGEKVRAIAAQRGFFIARAFTKDAEAQSKLDSRIDLLTVVELDPSTVLIPANFHGIHEENTNAAVSFHAVNEGAGAVQQTIDIETVKMVLDGQHIDASEYIQRIIAEARQARVNSFPSGCAEEGRHELEFSTERVFVRGAALLDNRPLLRVVIKGTTEVVVCRAVVVSAFEVASRGRHITVKVKMPVTDVRADFVSLDPALTPKRTDA